MPGPPWDNQLAALEQLDIDINFLCAAIIANQQAFAALSTSGVTRTTVDFINVALASRSSEATLLTRATEATLLTRNLEATQLLVLAQAQLAVRNPNPTLVNSQPAMGVASATVVAANAARRYLRIKNSGATVVFIKFGTPAVVTNYPLQQFEAWESNSPNIYTGQVTGITAAGATTLDVIEG